jgi:hypothetical protein
MVLVRLLIFLLLSIAAGAAVYLGGAVVWCLADPDGAGEPLLFSIPLALVTSAIPGLLGMLGMVNTNAWRQNARPMPTARPMPVRIEHKPIPARRSTTPSVVKKVPPQSVVIDDEYLAALH